MGEWTIEAVRIEMDYRLSGTRDRTSRAHLADVCRVRWWRRAPRRADQREHR